MLPMHQMVAQTSWVPHSTILVLPAHRARSPQEQVVFVLLVARVLASIYQQLARAPLMSPALPVLHHVQLVKNFSEHAGVRPMHSAAPASLVSYSLPPIPLARLAVCAIVAILLLRHARQQLIPNVRLAELLAQPMNTSRLPAQQMQITSAQSAQPRLIVEAYPHQYCRELVASTAILPASNARYRVPHSITLLEHAILLMTTHVSNVIRLHRAQRDRLLLVHVD